MSLKKQVVTPFPDNFVWGAAASSFQIEGAACEDGKGLSIWDAFGKKPGAIWQGQTCEVACDHYHLWKQDIALMKEIGIKAYRLSVSWPRVIPNGTGKVNRKGLDFYNRLIDGLLAAGIIPYVDLYHWDYPYELHCRGGWMNDDCSDWFADYTAVVVKELSDRVRHWMTLNEPNGFIGAGYQAGIHAPGLTVGPLELLRAIHNVLLCHGKAALTIRALAPRNSTIGFVWAGGGTKAPFSNSKRDVEAARRAMFAIKKPKPSESIDIGESWWLDPVYLGHYPEEGLAAYEPYLPAIGPGDMKIIHQPLDHFCVNIYQAKCIRANPRGEPEQVPLPTGGATVLTDNRNIQFALMPEALYWGPRFFQERYKKPVMITENGMPAINDWPSVDGKVHDALRIDYIQRYLSALRRACADGVDIRGYFYWTIMDNFESCSGYKERYGIIHVDYVTQKRIIKDSGRWYGEVIKTNGRHV